MVNREKRTDEVQTNDVVDSEKIKWCAPPEPSLKSTELEIADLWLECDGPG